MEKEKIQALNKELEKRFSKKDGERSSSISMYRVLNSKGEIYSRFQGWRKIDGETFGHIFYKKQFPVVLEVLKENGYEDISVEKDMAGTLLMIVDKSPLSTPKKMVKTTLVIGFIFVVILITNQIWQTEFLQDYISTMKIR